MNLFYVASDNSLQKLYFLRKVNNIPEMTNHFSKLNSIFKDPICDMISLLFG